MESFNIDRKIVAVNLAQEEKIVEHREKLHEKVDRPGVLEGKTYKIKPGEHALYITINDIVLNQGSSFEERRPFEIFINTKDPLHRQWMDALTRVISAVFRKGGQYDFLIEELKCISDPKGGHWRNRRFVPSLAAEVGYILEEHIGTPTEAEIKIEEESIGFPKEATTCGACGIKALVVKDGCPTCLNCGDSKCG